jgi:hypothetical protein
VYVYIWKTPEGIPFYVGMAKNVRRPSPKSIGHRNEACKAKVAEIGADNVIIELHTVSDVESAKEMERSFIELYGRICNSTGTLTNIARGGEFTEPSEETRRKLKEVWCDPVRSEAISKARRKPRKLAESTKQELRERLKANPAMQGWSQRNGEPEFEVKRIAGLRAVQDKIREKLNDLAAKELRKKRLKETVNSPEYKAKRKLLVTPEYRAKLSAAKRAYWEKKRQEKVIKLSKHG